MPEMRDRTLTVIGSTSVGKSALTIRFIDKKFEAEYEPTMSRTYRHKIATNGIDYQLTVIDTAGLEHNAQIPMQYINSHGFILVYSIADRQSFEVVCNIYTRLVDELDSPKVPLVLIGNKSDLNGQRKISYDAGHQLAQKWREQGSQASFIETSALTGEKVEDVFVTLLNLVDRPTDATNNKQTPATTRQTSYGERSTTSEKNNKNCTVS